MTNKPQTIRESIEAYRRRIAEIGFDSDIIINQRYYPDSNHAFAMKASSDEIKRIFEESKQFEFVREVIRPENGWYNYVWNCLPTDTKIIARCLDRGGFDGGWVCESWNLSEGWIPMELYPYSSSRLNTLSEKNPNEFFSFKRRLGEHAKYTGAIETLEVLLSIAEKYRIPMITQHMEPGEEILVRYFPEPIK